MTVTGNAGAQTVPNSRDIEIDITGAVIRVTGARGMPVDYILRKRGDCGRVQ